MSRVKTSKMLVLLSILVVLMAPLAYAQGPVPVLVGGSDEAGTAAASPQTSFRLIVELQSPPLAVQFKSLPGTQSAAGRLDAHSPAAQSYINQLQAEQAAFVSTMQTVLPSASVDSFVDEFGNREALAYQVVFNGLTIDPGQTDRTVARHLLMQIPGVKSVFLDYAHSTDLYTSTYLIDAPALWNYPGVGGQANAGHGVKIASVDGGLYKDSPMFSGAGYSYPLGYPPGGLGLQAGNNGKIIASRVYFREWDPPTPGNGNPWPGPDGISHGVHTSSIAAGEVVTATYLGLTFPNMSGVAPGAWLMSYRVFYPSVRGDASAYSAELMAALEDVVTDGADAVNNSWGGGPGSLGGEFDPVDQALINAADAGVFVSMSEGNSGPGLGTGDHPSPEYISVAASTTGGNLASGRLSVSGPATPPADLQDMPFTIAQFGPAPASGMVFTYTYATSDMVDPGNVLGCDPFPAGAFSGKAAVILRGTCNFSQKVYNAQEAGAEFVVVRNSAAGGDALITMAPGVSATLVTISSVFVGYTNGSGMVTWNNLHPTDSELTLNTLAFQAGNMPDQIADFSSRGPGGGNVLKPDIAAPGVNILAQGYTPGASGEAQYLGWGQASGTSMAAPHVTGSAALLREIHPDWSNAYIKSALMSTAKYLDVYNMDGSPAQPLDMGAGRLDLTNAADPGVILSPPSLSFGLVPADGQKMLMFTMTNIGAAAEAYTLTTLYTGAGFTMTTPLPGLTVSPTSVMLAAGGSATIMVTFDAATSAGVGDNQGFVVMEGEMHDAHMPAWARVVPAMAPADVLIIENDGNYTLGFPSYLGYYTSTLESLALTYDVWNADEYYGNPTTIPEAAVLEGYPIIIYYTGDNFYPDGTFTVATPLTPLDMDILTEYVDNGGILIAMGQDMAAVLGADAYVPPNTGPDVNLYGAVFGANWLQDSASGYGPPVEPIVPMADAAPAFQDLVLSVMPPSQGVVLLAGTNEVPPVATTTYGQAGFLYHVPDMTLDYDITIVVSEPITITGAGIYSGTAGMNGSQLFDIFTPAFTMPVYVSDTLSWGGSVVLNVDDEALLMSGGLYVNVLTEDYPGGEVRGQVEVGVSGDGAGNQYFIDEIGNQPPYGVYGDTPSARFVFRPLLRYPSPYDLEDGNVSMAHRDQPTLERPGINYLGRTIYTSFGLEGVNSNLPGFSTRAEVLGTFLNWALDEPTVDLTVTGTVTTTNQTYFEATLDSPIPGVEGISYRWDFGDGSPIVGPHTLNQAVHTYAQCGLHTVRVEVIDSYGNLAIGQTTIDVDVCSQYMVYMPMMFKNYTYTP
jgi:subtilisin family serine protease